MRHNRFYIQANLDGKQVEVADRDLAHQVAQVLKLAIGDEVILFNSEEKEVLATLAGCDKKSVLFDILSPVEPKVVEERSVTLYCALLKHDNFDMVVQKATECGVTRIVPLISDHAIKRDANMSRLHKIAKEAVEQSGRVRLPVIDEPVEAMAALENASEQVKIFFDMAKKEVAAADVTKARSVAVFVGPEGGWSDREKALGAKQCTVRALGSYVLRAETAATVATYVAIHL